MTNPPSPRTRTGQAWHSWSGTRLATLAPSWPRGRWTVGALGHRRACWHAPRTILATDRLLFLPTVAANGNGEIAVTWDSVSSANPSGKVPATVMAAVSDDQGRTWKIAPLGHSPTLPRLADRELFTGDYQG